MEETVKDRISEVGGFSWQMALNFSVKGEGEDWEGLGVGSGE
jgi:hypothetical protein